MSGAGECESGILLTVIEGRDEAIREDQIAHFIPIKELESSETGRCGNFDSNPSTLALALDEVEKNSRTMF